MQSTNSIFLTPFIIDWLANSHQPRILHVFDQACNLINERRDILSVVTSQIGNGPFNLVIEKDVSFCAYLSLESPVTISHSQLHLGELTINIGGAKPWSARPDWEMLHSRRSNILNQLMGCSTTILHPKLQIANYRKASLWDQSLSSSFSSALINADIPTALNLSSQLAGLGQGLTPAGDDFILGALLAVWIIHPQEVASVLAEEVANTAAPLTTSLSAAWLRSAGRGAAGIRWHDLFNALIAGEDIQLPITRLLSVGETSGADALAGFVGVFRSWVGNASSIRITSQSVFQSVSDRDGMIQSGIERGVNEGYERLVEILAQRTA